MSTRRPAYAVACTLGIGIGCGTVSGQEPPAGLTKNPFSRPDYMVVLQDAPAAIFAPEPVELRLIATLVSNGSPLANIDGEVLTTGDTYEGYRVLAIREGRVVLMKDGERTTLDLHDRTDTDETRD